MPTTEPRELLLTGRAPAGLRIEGDLSLARTKIRFLPPGLTVTGTLDLRATVRLRSIGEGLRVGGDLLLGGSDKLRGCTSPAMPTPLEALPTDMEIDGSLELGSCVKLRALPDGLQVGKSLCVRGCHALASLPERLHIKGDFILCGAPRLTQLPAVLGVRGDLGITGTNVERLPAGLKVGGDLRLTHCRRLEMLGLGHTQIGNDLEVSDSPCPALPPGLSIPGSLRLGRCPELVSLSDCLSVGADLKVRDCSKLTQLPDPLRVPGTILLRDCRSLALLPTNLRAGSVTIRNAPIERLPSLRVGTDLRLEFLEILERLPDGLTVPGELSLFGATSLQSLPANLEVGGDLDLGRCRALTALPAKLRIKGRLDLGGCSALTTLPAGLKPISINLAGCRALTTLPAGLNLKYLDIEDCGSLRELPDDLKVARTVDIAGAGLTSWPRSLAKATVRWRGVFVSPRVVFSPETLTPSEIFRTANAELRRVMLERAGIDAVLEKAKAKVIDADTDQGGPRRIVEVAIEVTARHRGNPRTINLRFLDCRCPSTGRRYLLGLPTSIEQCRVAAAWLAGFDDPDDYQPISET